MNYSEERSKMRKDDLERMLLAEDSFLEHWIVQFSLYSDLSAFTLGFKRMQKRHEWVKSELNKIKDAKG